MAQERKSTPMQTQIKTLSQQGVSIRNIARSLGLSRQTVRKYMTTEDGNNSSDGSTTSEAAIAPSNAPTAWHTAVDWEAVRGEMTRKGCTVKQVHIERAPDVSYWSFWRHLKIIFPKTPSVTIRIQHVIGERTEIDYADGVLITDRNTGKTRKTYLFCAVLPFSSYIYGEFSSDQKLPSFIASQERMWNAFGGVTPYVVIDNLKSGVTKAHRYDPDINPTYCAYANHTGFAVLPARPYKPRDKASVEASIGAIQRSFFATVRNRIFYSLEEINEVFRLFLVEMNNTVMKDYGVSRIDRFSEERLHLKPLPLTRFEITEWRSAKVHPDCHIKVERNFYSVPHIAVGKTVRVRLSANLIEVFTEDTEPLAAHARMPGNGRFSTQEQHYPDKKLGIKRFEIHTAQQRSRKIGEHTEALVTSLVSIEYPLRHLRRIQGILRLVDSGHVTCEALEYACQMALNFRKPRMAYIKSCAEYYHANGSRPTLVKPERNRDDLYLHNQEQTDVISNALTTTQGEV